MRSIRPDPSALDTSVDDGIGISFSKPGWKRAITRRRDSHTFRCSAWFCISLAVRSGAVLTLILRNQNLTKDFNTKGNEQDVEKDLLFPRCSRSLMLAINTKCKQQTVEKDQSSSIPAMFALLDFSLHIPICYRPEYPAPVDRFPYVYRASVRSSSDILGRGPDNDQESFS